MTSKTALLPLICMKRNLSKPATNADIDALARMIKKGFDDTASKSDLTQLRIELQELRTEMGFHFAAVDGALEKLAPLPRTAANLELDVFELGKRVRRLEKKQGLAK